MTQTVIIFPVFAFLLSCNNADTGHVITDTTRLKVQTVTPPDHAKRQFIIDELKRIRAIFASEDKEQIATIFEFPLSDSTIPLYIDDSAYNAEFQQNGEKTTRTMFLRFFPEISESLQISELNQLFRNIRLEDLQYKDTLEREVHVKTEPCYNFYGIDIQNDSITLTTGHGVNSNFKSNAAEDEVTENSSEFCESVLWWVFRLEGNRLRFVTQHGAG